MAKFAIYIYKALCPLVCTYVTISVPPICLSPGDKHFTVTGDGGDKHFSHTIERGQTFFTHRVGDKHFCTEGGGQTIFVEDGGGYDDDDVDEEMDVSEANIVVSEAIMIQKQA